MILDFNSKYLEMKRLILLSVILLATSHLQAQSCADVMAFVKSKSNGTTYSSYNSDAISRVTFYEITIDYCTQYFAMVCFKSKYSLSCSEYIYQVGASTKFNYSMNYTKSAGEAYWEYIKPYSKNLGCGPD